MLPRDQRGSETCINLGHSGGHTLNEMIELRRKNNPPAEEDKEELGLESGEIKCVLGESITIGASQGFGVKTHATNVVQA